ncbi:MAG: VWA domain-containing protein [Ignavibacteria bacterium]|nr:VWA domain-containing protein [Ignavibacteria bacterium]
METRQKVHHLIILDESGSMNSIREPIIGTFNEIVLSTKECAKDFPEQEHFVTFVTFNSGGIKSYLNLAPLEKFEIITGRNYRPSAATPLFDAVGRSINGLRYELRSEKDYKVLVSILTDGFENASREFSGRDIVNLQDELRKSGNWTITYSGADHDVEAAASSMDIRNFSRFEKSAAGLNEYRRRERTAKLNWLRKIRENEDTNDGYYNGIS